MTVQTAQERIAELNAELADVESEIANDPRLLLRARRDQLEAERSRLAQVVAEQDRQARAAKSLDDALAALRPLPAQRAAALRYLREELPRIMSAVDVVGDGPAKVKAIQDRCAGNLRGAGQYHTAPTCNLGPISLDWTVVRGTIDRLEAIMRLAALTEGR